jgi:hypothetical protein
MVGTANKTSQLSLWAALPEVHDLQVERIGLARGYSILTTSGSPVIQGLGRERTGYSIIPLWLSLSSSEESMLADTGHFVRASSPKN